MRLDRRLLRPFPRAWLAWCSAALWIHYTICVVRRRLGLRVRGRSMWEWAGKQLRAKITVDNLARARAEGRQG
jgi:hypothetical protein